MIDRLPITKSILLDDLDDDDLILGYFDGLDNSPEPGDNRSFSYWHGWKNGMVDGKHRYIDVYQKQLASDVVSAGYLKNYCVVDDDA